MKYLLDTHCWLWWIAAPQKLSEKARGLLVNSANDIYFSAASSWEITIKYRLKKLPLPEAPDTFIISRLHRDGIIPLSIEHGHVLYTGNLPLHHRDPFDRLLIAQSILEKMPIITVDPLFFAYSAEIVFAGLEPL
jgi:PIN domain nuclease of toxin-antitoxin system